MFVRIKDVQHECRVIAQSRAGFLMMELIIAIGVMIITAVLLVNHYAYRSVLYSQFVQRIVLIDECKNFLQKTEIGRIKSINKKYTVETINIPVCVRNFAGEVKPVERFKWITCSFPWPSIQQSAIITMIGGYDEQVSTRK